MDITLLQDWSATIYEGTRYLIINNNNRRLVTLAEKVSIRYYLFMTIKPGALMMQASVVWSYP